MHSLESLEEMAFYLEDLARLPRISRHAEQHLIAQIALNPTSSAADTARMLLIEANLHMVVRLARRYHPWGLALADLVQEGNLALVQAIRRFDPTCSQPVRIFARSCVDRALLAVVRTSLREQFLPEQERREECEQMGEMAISPLRAQTLAALLCAALDKETQTVALPPARWVSLDALSEEEAIDVLDEDDRFSVQAYCREHKSIDTIEELVLVNERGAILLACLHPLSERERQVLFHRFLSQDPLTLEKIGKRLGVTCERVRQLEVSALRRMRHARFVQRIHPGSE